MKINNFQGELSDISVKTATLVLCTGYHRIPVRCSDILLVDSSLGDTENDSFRLHIVLDK